MATYREAVSAVAADAPVRELGVQRSVATGPGSAMSLGGVDLGWASFLDDIERVPELKWPQSIRVLDQMRTDAQLSGLYRAMTYPIRRFKFMIDPNGCPDAVVEGVADDMNLDIVGRDPRPRKRRKARFSFDDFRFHALLALCYGHMGFNQVGKIIDAPGFPGGQRWMLTKLLPLMPRTIGQINVAADGGLISVRQNLRAINQGGGMFGTMGGFGPPIPVGNMVWFPWEKEGPNWPGRSIFRDCHKNWVIKDRLMRVDAINHERAGGVPVATAQPGASPADIAQLNDMASKFHVHEEAGGALPSGAKLELFKVGSGTDVINSIRYHDEAMAKLFLHMFIQLGQTETGSRALGQSFIEYAFIAQAAVAQWFVDICNEHVIEDWVDWNWADESMETAPLLTYVIEEEDEHLAVTELVALITAGAVQVDEELEDSLRERYKLPPRQAGAKPPPGVSAKEWDLAKLQMSEEVDRLLLEAALSGDLGHGEKRLSALAAKISSVVKR